MQPVSDMLGQPKNWCSNTYIRGFIVLNYYTFDYRYPKILIIVTFVSYLIGERKLFLFNLKELFSLCVYVSFICSTKPMIMSYVFHIIIMIMVISRAINYVLPVVITMLILTDNFLVLNFDDTCIDLWSVWELKVICPKVLFCDSMRNVNLI